MVSKFLPLPDCYFTEGNSNSLKIVCLTIVAYTEQNRWDDALHYTAKYLKSTGFKYKFYEIHYFILSMYSFDITSAKILPLSCNLFLLEYLRASMGLEDTVSKMESDIFKDISPKNYVNVSNNANEILAIVNTAIKKMHDPMVAFKSYRLVMAKLSQQYKLSIHYNNPEIKKITISTMNQLISDYGYLVTSYVLNNNKSGFGSFRVKSVNTDELSISLETKSDNYRILNGVLTLKRILNPLLTIVETTGFGTIGVIDFHFLICPDSLFLLFQYQMKNIIKRLKSGHLGFSKLKLICGRGQHSLITGYAPIRLMILRLLIKIGLLEYCNADPYQTAAERFGLKIEIPFMLEILSIEEKDLHLWLQQISDTSNEFHSVCKDFELI